MAGGECAAVGGQRRPTLVRYCRECIAVDRDTGAASEPHRQFDDPPGSCSGQSRKIAAATDPETAMANLLGAASEEDREVVAAVMRTVCGTTHTPLAGPRL